MEVHSFFFLQSVLLSNSSRGSRSPVSRYNFCMLFCFTAFFSWYPCIMFPSTSLFFLFSKYLLPNSFISSFRLFFLSSYCAHSYPNIRWGIFFCIFFYLFSIFHPFLKYFQITIKMRKERSIIIGFIRIMKNNTQKSKIILYPLHIFYYLFIVKAIRKGKLASLQVFFQ